MKKDKKKTRSLLKAIGPGVLYAGAAIGASHLVESTRAGAGYGFSIAWAICLVIIFKYPFFEFGHRFTAATGKTLIEGYSMLGSWVLPIFLILNFLTGIINFAAIALVTTTLGAYVFGIDVNSTYLSASLLTLILVMLFVGKYAFLDKFMKILILILSIATAVAFIIALTQTRTYAPDFVPPELWNVAGVTFLIALMGWMPTPIEASAWPSLWAIERKLQTGYTPRFSEYQFDFHLGYIGSTVLAFLFLGLGALIMYGSGESFAGSSQTFSEKLVWLYSNSLGRWSIPFVSGIAFITILTTALTVIDGYPRTLVASLIELVSRFKSHKTKLYWASAIILSFLAELIIFRFSGQMKLFLDFAMIVSFLAAPFFAIINYQVVTSEFMPENRKPKLILKSLSWLGIIFLIGFGLVFMYMRLWF